jgi:hypothetical protein
MLQVEHLLLHLYVMAKLAIIVGRGDSSIADALINLLEINKSSAGAVSQPFLHNL